MWQYPKFDNRLFNPLLTTTLLLHSDRSMNYRQHRYTTLSPPSASYLRWTNQLAAPHLGLENR